MSWSSARLGFVHLDLGLYSDPSNPAWLPKARGELDRALELEPELALPLSGGGTTMKCRVPVIT